MGRKKEDWERGSSESGEEEVVLRKDFRETKSFGVKALAWRKREYFATCIKFASYSVCFCWLCIIES